MPLEFRTFAVGPLDTNCYLVWDRDTRAAAIIDPGGDCSLLPSPPRRGAGGEVFDIQWILLTHGHIDHTFCAGELAAQFGARVGVHELDVPLLNQGFGIAEMYYDLSKHMPVTPTDLLTDGRVIELGASEIKVIHTPGHSRGGLSFVTGIGVFCGDTIFAGSVGRTDFPGGDFGQLIESIRTKLLTLDDSIPLYPGHGLATTVGEERRCNPYLR